MIDFDKLKGAAEIARTDLAYALSINPQQSWRYEQSIKMITEALDDAPAYGILKERWRREEKERQAQK